MGNYKEKLLTSMTANTGLICVIAEKLQHHPIAKHLTGQLVRSGSAVSLIYSESINAESVKDLIHKLAMTQKELRETKTNLLILSQLRLPADIHDAILSCLNQTDEHLAQISKGLLTLRATHRTYLQNRNSNNQT